MFSVNLQVLEIDWNIKPKKVFRERILQWAQLVASVIPDSGMEHFHKEQMLVDILLDPE